MSEAVSADASPRDYGEPGERALRLPRPLQWLRWFGWALTHRAYTRHHLASYVRMARASLRSPSLRFEGPVFIGPDVRFEVREGYSRIIVGAFTHFGAHARVRAHEGTLRIGSKSVIGIRNTINCWLDIDIGRACLFGDDVYVCDFHGLAQLIEDGRRHEAREEAARQARTDLSFPGLDARLTPAS